MKQLIPLLLIGLVIVSGCTSPVTKPPTPPSKDSAKLLCDKPSLPDEEFIKRYNYWRDKFHLDKELEHIMQRAREFQAKGKEEYPWNYSWFTDELHISREIDEDIPEFGTRVTVNKQGIKMCFTPDGVLWAITNNLVREIGKIYNWEVNPGAKVIPKKSKEEILKQAEQYRDELLGERMKKYSLGPVKQLFFDDNPSWYGVWKVSWPRMINGYEVEGDDVSIYIHEEYGLCEFAELFLSDPCPIDIKISQDEAEKIALKLSQKTLDSMNSQYTSEHSPILKSRPKAEAEVGWTKLLMVQPGPGILRQKKLILVYRIVIKWCEDEKEWRDESFRIDVNAITGEISLSGSNFPRISGWDKSRGIK
ncbi:MAG: hypothetical protein V1701_11995 [Planctomycetota bacterium]